MSFQITSKGCIKMSNAKTTEFPSSSELFWPDWKNSPIYPIGPSFNHHDKNMIEGWKKSITEIESGLNNGFLGIFGKKHDHNLARKILSWDFTRIMICGDKGSGRTAVGLKFARRIAMAKKANLSMLTILPENSPYNTVPWRYDSMIVSLSPIDEKEPSSIAFAGEYGNFFKKADNINEIFGKDKYQFSKGYDYSLSGNSESIEKASEQLFSWLSDITKSNVTNTVFVIDGIDELYEMPDCHEIIQCIDYIKRNNNSVICITSEQSYNFIKSHSIIHDKDETLDIKMISPGDPALALFNDKLFLIDVKHEPNIEPGVSP